MYDSATDTINFIKVFWRVIDAPRLGTELDLSRDQFNFLKLEFLLNCRNELGMIRLVIKASEIGLRNIQYSI